MEVLIAGYTIAYNPGNELSGLVLALKDEIGIRYCGCSKTGFEPSETQTKLLSLLEPLTIEKSPFHEQTALDVDALWVKPVLVCEVGYKTISPEGLIKGAEFLWLREDKNIIEHLGKLA